MQLCLCQEPLFCRFIAPEHLQCYTQLGSYVGAEVRAHSVRVVKIQFSMTTPVILHSSIH